MYYDEVRQPTEEEIQLIQAQANLASITIERQQNEEARRRSEERFKNYAEVSSDWFWEMDRDLRFSFFSDDFENITGVPQATLLGKTREETGIPNVDPDAWEIHLADLRAHRKFENFNTLEPSRTVKKFG